jgi:hypothetical protein
MSKSIIIDKAKRSVRYIKNSNFFTSKVSYRSNTVKINQTLPFRIRFTNIGIPGYGQNGAAPIGIAVIGISNYVM